MCFPVLETAQTTINREPLRKKEGREGGREKGREREEERKREKERGGREKQTNKFTENNVATKMEMELTSYHGKLSKANC